jgi:hypothetical protein
MLYQFKIKLRVVTKPPVWRRVLVPSQFTFDAFHQVIQNAFGWEDEHLYQFGDVPYSQDLDIAIPYPDDWSSPTHDSRKCILENFFGNGTGNTKA